MAGAAATCFGSDFENLRRACSRSAKIVSCCCGRGDGLSGNNLSPQPRTFGRQNTVVMRGAIIENPCGAAYHASRLVSQSCVPSPPGNQTEHRSARSESRQKLIANIRRQIGFRARRLRHPQSTISPARIATQGSSTLPCTRGCDTQNYIRESMWFSMAIKIRWNTTSK